MDFWPEGCVYNRRWPADPSPRGLHKETPHSLKAQDVLRVDLTTGRVVVDRLHSLLHTGVDKLIPSREVKTDAEEEQSGRSDGS